MKSRIEGKQLIVCPEGRITYENAPDVEREMLEIVEQNPDLELVVDAEHLKYVSSAGLRILLRFSRRAPQKQKILNAGRDLYDTLEITGFLEFLDVQRKMREIRVEGCEEIGRGALGTVYRIDEETIVKVYGSPDCLPLIQLEQERARQALVRGLPTAISYDIVRTEKGYGSVFEMIRAENVNDTLRRNPEQTEQLLREYVQLLHRVHSAQALPGELPDARGIFLKYVEELREILPEDVAGGLEKLLCAMPEDLHMVHGDIQMKNVMLADEEMMLIDMETLCTGDPVFDLQGLFVTYRAFNEDEPDNSMTFLGISQEESISLWDRILAYYFEGRNEEQIRKEEDKIRLVGYMRFLDRVVTHGMTLPELKEIRIRHTVAHMRELLERVDTLRIRDDE